MERELKARSSGGEHYPDTVGVMGSNPIVPTMNTKGVVTMSQSFFYVGNRYFSFFCLHLLL